jgi:hypothetical protein
VDAPEKFTGRRGQEKSWSNSSTEAHSRNHKITERDQVLFMELTKA